MKARVLLRRAAELDLAGIEDWYESQNAGLEAEFREAVDQLFGRIGQNPQAFPERYRRGRGAICGVFLTSSGTGYMETPLSSWPAFTEAVILGSRASAFARAPNPRLQRTPLRAPLSRKPLGDPEP